MSVAPRARLASLVAPAAIGADRAGKHTPEAILAAAAVHGARARAGWRASTAAAPIAACPRESMPLASAGAMAMLERLLAEPDKAVIEEWAALALARGLRVRESLAPGLLEWWASQHGRNEAVFQVLGARGPWLASMNPAWQRAVAGGAIPEDADERWQTGTMTERLSVLLTVRSLDPARARAMVESTWTSDGAEARRRFIESLERNLSLADEGLLERALDDASKHVRRRAARLLGEMPGSGLRSRMTERARAMIVIGRGRARGEKVSVTLEPPATYDPAWERDGVEEAVAGGRGKRAWWMAQIIAGADVSVWTEATGLAPAGVLAAIEKDDYRKDALESLVGPVRRSGDRAWCESLAEALLKSTIDWEGASLWERLPALEQEAIILAIVERGRLSLEQRWAFVSSRSPGWPRAYSERAMGVLARHAPRAAERAYAPAIMASMDEISRVIDPGSIEAFERVVSATLPSDGAPFARRAIDRVRLRSDIHKEFAS